jgi:hypothetical protein
VNPTPKAEEEVENQTTTPGDEFDVSKLLLQVRSRYKVLCSVLGVPLRLRSIATGLETFSGDTTSEMVIQKAFATIPTKSNTVWPIERQSPDNSTLEL